MLRRRPSVTSNSSVDSNQTAATETSSQGDESSFTSELTTTSETSFVGRLSMQLNSAFSWFDEADEGSFERGGVEHSTLALRAVIEKDRKRRQSLVKAECPETGITARLERIRAEAKAAASSKQRDFPELVADWKQVLLSVRPCESSKLEKAATALAISSIPLMDEKRRQTLRAAYPLHEAAQQGDAELTNMLLRVGFCISAKDQAGRTAADLAHCYDEAASHHEVLQLLGAEPTDVASI